MRLRVFPAIIAAIVVSVSLSSCSREPILVGVPLVLTGVTGHRGVSCRNGMELALDEINASGGVRGRCIELLVRDDQDDPRLAMVLDQEAVKAGAVAILGHLSSGDLPAALLYANEQKIPILSPTVSSDDYSGKDDWFFRISGSTGGLGECLADWALRKGYRRIAACCERGNASYSQSLLASFTRRFEAGGGRVIASLTFTSIPGMNYGDLVEALLSPSPDAILPLSSSFDLAFICQNLSRRGSSTPVLGGMWSMTSDLFEFGGRTVEGYTIASYYNPSSDIPDYLRFREAYRARYATEPDLASAVGYDSMRYLALALERADSLSGPDIKKALLSAGAFRTLQGEITMDRFGDVVQNPYILTVRNSRFDLEK